MGLFKKKAGNEQNYEEDSISYEYCPRCQANLTLQDRMPAF